MGHTLVPQLKSSNKSGSQKRKARGLKGHDNYVAKAKFTGTRKFIGVDGEGISPESGHRYVLFGVGQEQISNINGLDWSEIFEFLYSFREKGTAFVGFYLGYDFTQWLKTLPEERARKLLTIDGKAARKSNSAAMHGRYLPVDVDNWQVDMLGAKRMQIRPRVCECLTAKCDHTQNPWLYICDAGPFFQTSFMKVIDPKQWEEPIVTAEEYATIKEGKDNRSTAELGPDMCFYNRLENEILARVMADLDQSFRMLGITLAPSQWFGPGQAAQAFMKGRAPTTSDIQEYVPDWFTDAARASYFGGWFEIMAHGHIPGTSYEYDINSAYPSAISKLPCLLHGSYTRGRGLPMVGSQYCLVYTRVKARSQSFPIGTMLHRTKDGRICRPMETEGWYWLHELEAAQKAGLIAPLAKKHTREWVNYDTCKCISPLWEVKNLYNRRLAVGKKTSLGKACKLIANSIYGKYAQSTGHPIYGNPVYASLITSSCRTTILNAIFTHPWGVHSVLMVATDAVFFTKPHPNLPISTALGEWDYEERPNLTLFKPGVYWDDKARDQILRKQNVTFKARGISAKDFSEQISNVDLWFEAWRTPEALERMRSLHPKLDVHGFDMWPKVTFTSTFAMMTALQALQRNKWELAGTINDNMELVQSSYPGEKRQTARWDHDSDFMRTLPRVVDEVISLPYEKQFGLDDPFSQETMEQIGVNPDEPQTFFNLRSILTAND